MVSLGKTRPVFVLAALLGLSGCCGGQPYIQPAAPPQTSEVVTGIEADPRSVHIIVTPLDPAAPPPEVIVQQGPQVAVQQPSSGWVPDALPAENPFERHRTWVGDYDCTQGNTGFALRIMDVRGRVVRAIFDFMHAPSGANGSYIVTGHFDPETRKVHFDPSSWIVQPAEYVMVSMSGEVSADSSLFAGKIDHRGCGYFTLKPTR